MAAPKIYKSTDAAAPVMRGERRALVDVLRACLVDGYGDKAAAGWTLEYINATFDKAVFRNNPATGTGFFLQVNGFSTANAYTHALQGYEVMSDIDNGIGLFNTGVAQEVYSSNAASPASRPWVLLADDRAFFLFIWHTTTVTPPTTANLDVTGIFFGDVIARLPGDAFACALCASNLSQFYIFGGAAAPSSGATVPATATPPYFRCHFPRRENGAVGGVTVALIRGGGPCHDNAPGMYGIPYTSADPLYLSQPFFSNGTAYSIRGWFPGLYFPCHPLPFGQLETVVKDSRTFLSIRNNFYAVSISPSNLLISLDDWRL